MKSILAAIGIAAFAAFSAEVKHEVIRSGASADVGKLAPGSTVPDFTLADGSGTELTLSSVAADEKLVIVDFWGAWCGPCRLEMPALEKLYTDSTTKGLQILAVDEGDSRAALDAYLKKRPLNFPMLRDSTGDIAERFGVRAFPTTVLVGRDGKIIRVVEGIEPYFSDDVRNRLKASDAKP